MEVQTMQAFLWDDVYGDHWPVQLIVIAPDLETARKLGQAELRAYHAESNVWSSEELETATAEQNAQFTRVATLEPEVRELPCAFSIARD
jgi:hypothetical protein